MNLEYTYGRKRIEAEVIYSNRKNIDLRVFSEGKVLKTVPEGLSIETILEKVKLKSKWVMFQLKAIELYRPFTIERLYIPGETHRYLGRLYKLVVNKKDKGNSTINLRKGLFTINTSSDNIEMIIHKFYKSKADVLFRELMDNLLNRFKVFKNYEIILNNRFMKKWWGNCSTDSRILINTELIKASKPCIEYVIMYEFCHLIEPNHSKKFYSLLTDFLPNWE